MSGPSTHYLEIAYVCGMCYAEMPLGFQIRVGKQ